MSDNAKPVAAGNAEILGAKVLERRLYACARQADPPMRLSSRDLVLLAVLTVLWGVNWPIMKIGVRDFAPLTFRTISMAGGLVVLAVAARLAGQSLRVPREHWRETAVLAFFNMVVWYVLAIYGVKLLSSGRAALLGYTMPIFTAVFGFLLYGDRPGARLWIGVAAAAIGVALLLSGEFSAIAGQPLGTLLMLGAAASWALGTQWTRKRRQPTQIVVLTFWSLAIAFAVCALIALVFERSQWVRPPNAAEWGAIAFNAFAVFGFCQVVWFRLATILPPVASGLSVTLIPVIGVFSGMAILGETPHWQDYAALVAILAAIVCVLGGRRDDAPVRPPPGEVVR